MQPQNSQHLETNKQLVRRYYEEIVNTGNVERIADFIGDEYAEEWENALHPVGIEGAKAHVLGVRATYPDLKLTIQRQIAEEDWVVSQVTMRGTHSGPWMGIQPTGRVIAVTGVNMDQVRDGRIILHTGAANLLGPLIEIGAVEPKRNGE